MSFESPLFSDQKNDVKKIWKMILKGVPRETLKSEKIIKNKAQVSLGVVLGSLKNNIKKMWFHDIPQPWKFDSRSREVAKITVSANLWKHL